MREKRKTQLKQNGPRKGDSFDQFNFWSRLFFSIHISFVKYKYIKLSCFHSLLIVYR